MTNDIALSELQEFIAGFWYLYDEAHYDDLAATYAEDVHYVTRSDSGVSPFEELMSPDIRGRDAVMAWLIEHRKESPYPLRHHATNVHRTGGDGVVTKARFYILVNQIANFVPFAVSSGVVDVGVRRRCVRSRLHRHGSRSGHSEFGSAVRAHRQYPRGVVSARDTFSGGVAVITGAGAGLGAGIARYASQLGMTVVLADIDGEAIARLRGEISEADGTAHDVVCDVRDADAMESLAENTYREFGAVRLLVNNAGIEQFGYLWDTPIANWQRVVDVNVSGVFHGVRAFLPRMMDSDEPAWVWNLSSVGGVVAIPLQAPYIMSKHAVLALTECLHLDVQSAGHADHIHVQAVLPGAVVSNIFESAGGVDTGDVAAANAQRSAMLRIKAAAMDPLAAAETVFDQSAAGKFYLLTQDSVGAAMDERANILAAQRAPAIS